MATVARFTVPVDGFPFAGLWERLPDATIELERIVPTNGAVVPYLWVRGASVTDVVDAFEDHPGIQSITPVDRVDDQHLLRCEWDRENRGILDVIVDAGVALLSAVGTASGWSLVVRGDDRDAVGSFHQRCLDGDYPVTLRELHALSSADVGGHYGLTDPQREALVLAHERGYFEEPRRVTMMELAEELGISRQAFSSRLRRAHETLVANTVLAD